MEQMDVGRKAFKFMFDKDIKGNRGAFVRVVTSAHVDEVGVAVSGQVVKNTGETIFTQSKVLLMAMFGLEGTKFASLDTVTCQMEHVDIDVELPEKELAKRINDAVAEVSGTQKIEGAVSIRKAALGMGLSGFALERVQEEVANRILSMYSLDELIAEVEKRSGLEA